MTNEKISCQICEKEVDSSSLNTCHSCGKKYCPECQSDSTDQKYCKECVGLSGVVTHKQPSLLLTTNTNPTFFTFLKRTGLEGYNSPYVCRSTGYLPVYEMARPEQEGSDQIGLDW